MIRKERYSGIEALKIIGILIIVVSHVTQTMNSWDVADPERPWMLPLAQSLDGWQPFVMSVLQHCGAIGNTIFFVCSSWFLLDSRQSHVRRTLGMAVQVWVVSVLIFSVFWACGTRPEYMCIKQSFMPIMTMVNWYITAYILFYAIHHHLNRIIAAMGQRQLLRTASTMFGLYVVVECLMKGPVPCSNFLTSWIAIYFLMAYIKRYAPKMADSRRANLVLLAAGVCGVPATTWLLGQCGESLLRFCGNNNPLIIMSVIGAFNLVRCAPAWRNSWVNGLSGLSLLIYIIHENVMVRSYLRPWVWQQIWQRDGHAHVVAWTLVYAVTLFAAAAVVAWAFQRIAGRPLAWLTDRLHAAIRWAVLRAEAVLLRLS